MNVIQCLFLNYNKIVLITSFVFIQRVGQNCHIFYRLCMNNQIMCDNKKRI